MPEVNKQLASLAAIRAQIKVLRYEISKNLGLRSLLWECGWGDRHFKGCLQSLMELIALHPDEMGELKGKDLDNKKQLSITLYSSVCFNWRDKSKIHR